MMNRCIIAKVHNMFADVNNSLTWCKNGEDGCVIPICTLENEIFVIPFGKNNKVQVRNVMLGGMLGSGYASLLYWVIQNTCINYSNSKVKLHHLIYSNVDENIREEPFCEKNIGSAKGMEDFISHISEEYEFRVKKGGICPYIVIIIERADYMLNMVNDANRSLFQKILVKGSNVGIHFLLSSTDPQRIIDYDSMIDKFDILLNMDIKTKGLVHISDVNNNDSLTVKIPIFDGEKFMDILEGLSG